MARVLVGLRRELQLCYLDHPLCPTGPTANLAVRVLGGVGYGVLAGHAEFWSDVRATSGMTREAVQEDVAAALAKLLPDVPGAEIALAFTPGLAWLPPTDVPAGHPAVTAC